MMNVNLISKIIGYVLLNACSLHSSGLYTRKVSNLLSVVWILRDFPAYSIPCRNMEKINLFLMDMSEDGTTTGVTRYMETLLRGLHRSLLGTLLYFIFILA
ncbi:hypothetical protein AB9N12_03910 [Bacteroides sp. AN502(2024)]|uniref:hypothetical protein n=1 Tax=Bacteroides sp. AN502(2024) TaxID=3160599 RepID=UPI003513119E